MKQVKNLIYRISLKRGATKLMEELALAAARSNGGEAPMAFPFISSIALSISKFEGDVRSITVTVEEEDKWLCIDMKSPQWEGYKTVLKIEQVEVMELVADEE